MNGLGMRRIRGHSDVPVAQQICCMCIFLSRTAWKANNNIDWSKTVMSRCHFVSKPTENSWNTYKQHIAKLLFNDWKLLLYDIAMVALLARKLWQNEVPFSVYGWATPPLMSNDGFSRRLSPCPPKRVYAKGTCFCNHVIIHWIVSLK